MAININFGGGGMESAITIASCIASTLLGCVAILLALFGAIGFGYIKLKAEKIAKEIAKETIEQQVNPLLKKLNEELNNRENSTNSDKKDYTASEEPKEFNELSNDNDI